MRRAGLVLCLLSLAISQIANAVETERVQFPGFSVLLPKGGEVVSTSTAPYSGSHTVKLPEATLLERLNPLNKKIARPAYTVTWTAADVSHQELVEAIRGNLLKVFPIPDARVLREKDLTQNTWIGLIGNSTMIMGIGDIACEPGFDVTVTLWTSRDHNEQWEELRKVMKSVQCALTDANRRPAEAAVRLPRGFARFHGELNATYATLDGEQLVITFTSSNLIASSQLQPKIFPAVFGQFMNIPPEKIQADLLTVNESANPPSALVRVQFPDRPAPMYIGLQWCSKLRLSFMAIYTATSVSVARMHVIMDSVACPGAPSEPVPNAGPIFEAACEAKNENACDLLQVYKP